MLYRPDYLLNEYRKQSKQAWNYYVDCLENDSTDKMLCIARDQYIRCHNDVTTINREIRKRDRTNQKPVQA